MGTIYLDYRVLKLTKTAGNSAFFQIKGGWTGTDANNFIGNACNYLNNLSYVETALVDFINIVAKRNQGYADRITSFYDALK